MKRLIFAGALVALSLTPLFAQDASSEFDALMAGDPGEASAPQQAWGTLKWAGDQELAWRFGVAEDPTRTGGTVDSKLSGEYKAGDLKLVGAAQVRNGEFVPGETLVSFSPGPLKVSAGYQEFSWGVADARNPTDTLNARDYRFGADAPRLVNPAASVALYPADWLSLEAVYEPWKEQSKFPKDFRAVTQAGLSDNAAALRAGFAAKLTEYTKAVNDATAALTSLANAGDTSSATYTSTQNSLGKAKVAKNITADLATKAATYNPVVTADRFQRDLSTPVYGGRANLFLPGVDLSVSYLYDVDPYFTPEVTMTSITGSTTTPVAASSTVWLPAEIHLVQNRVHRLGLNAKTTVDRFGLWVESAYNLGQDHEGNDDAVRNDSVAWTTGLDFNFGPSSAYYANLQYAGEWNLGYDDQTVSDYTAEPTTEQLADKAYMTKRTYRSLVQSLGSQSEALLNTVTASLKFPLEGGFATPTLSGAVLVPVGYDSTLQTRLASSFLKPELDLMPADGVHVLFGADLAYGWVKRDGASQVSLDTTTDKLGIFTPQNNVYVKVQYKWNGSLGD